MPVAYDHGVGHAESFVFDGSDLVYVGGDNGLALLDLSQTPIARYSIATAGAVKHLAKDPAHLYWSEGVAGAATSTFRRVPLRRKN